MKIVSNINLWSFDAWNGGKNTLETLYSNECKRLEDVLEQEYLEGMTDEELNDFLCYETDAIANLLGYNDWDDLLNDR